MEPIRLEGGDFLNSVKHNVRVRDSEEGYAEGIGAQHRCLATLYWLNDQPIDHELATHLFKTKRLSYKVIEENETRKIVEYSCPECHKTTWYTEDWLVDHEQDCPRVSVVMA